MIGIGLRGLESPDFFCKARANARGWRVEAPPTQGTLSEDPLGCSFEDSPGLCSKRPRESVRVPLLASPARFTALL